MTEARNWLAFAREDLVLAEAALEKGIFNQVCFHAQQGVEKALKAFLRSRQQSVPKTHALSELLTLCRAFEQSAGQLVIEPRLSIAEGFSEGLARIGEYPSGSLRWGYIDTTGQTAIPVQFYDAGEFSEGLAPVRISSQWGYIDTTGRSAIKPAFGSASTFSKGIAPCLH